MGKTPDQPTAPQDDRKNRDQGVAEGLDNEGRPKERNPGGRIPTPPPPD